ncbi:MAG: hypothetical protein PVJ09_05075 [Candidatus Woesebacteria bacterium]|jgi:hypothetical protein
MQKIKKFLIPAIIKHLFLILALFVFLLLSYKAPFSERTLIPNFEPYPDTFHYITSARCLLIGSGRKLCREGLSINPAVPPLYSYLMIPLFLLINDPRAVYYLNIALSLISLISFYLILKKLFKNQLLIGFSLFLYVTNFYIYWMPSLAMAENLLLPLTLLCLYLLLSPISKKNSFIFGLTAISLYATKYIAAPLTLAFAILFIIKLINSQEKNLKGKKISISINFCSAFLLGLMFFGMGAALRKVEEFSNGLIAVLKKNNLTVDSTREENENSFYSLSYLPKNLPLYIKTILGYPIRFLWQNKAILSNYLAQLGLLGLILKLRKAKTRFFAFSIIFLISIQILVVSLFYSFESRYIYYSIPFLILGFAFFLEETAQLLKKTKIMALKKHGIIFLIAITGILYLKANLIPWKQQLSLNFKYAETPWYYLAIKEVDQLITEKNFVKKPYLISAVNPYLFDFYSQDKFKLLPLSYEQDLFSDAKDVWGDHDYSDLIILYQSLLENGDTVLLTNYGLGNEQGKHNDFQTIKDSFELTELKSACYDLCNIYQLALKSEKETSIEKNNLEQNLSK